GRPTKVLLAFAVLKLNPARARKILPEKMGRARLNRLSVLDHRLKGQRLNGPGKFLAFRFRASEDGDREMILDESLIQIQNQPRFGASLRFGFMDGMSFLPQ